MRRAMLLKPASLQPCCCDITRCDQGHSGWEMESSCLVSPTLMLLVAVTLQKKRTTHPENCCSFRNSTAYPPHFTHIPASSARARRFAFVVCWSALWKLGHMQPEWLHHRRNSVKHLSRLFPLVPRKDLSAASAHIAHSLLLAAPPSITLLISSIFAWWLYPECTLGEILCFCKSGSVFGSVRFNAFGSDLRAMEIFSQLILDSSWV